MPRFSYYTATGPFTNLRAAKASARRYAQQVRERVAVYAEHPALVGAFVVAVYDSKGIPRTPGDSIELLRTIAECRQLRTKSS